MNGSNLVKAHLPCPDCGSSDGVAQYDDGHEWCFVHNGLVTHTDSISFEGSSSITNAITPIPNQFGPLEDRRISRETAKKFAVSTDPGKTHTYPYFDREDLNLHVGNKVRDVPLKRFAWEGNSQRAALFGQQIFPAGSAKTITLTEGELDAMSAFEMSGSRFPCVSVHSAGSAIKDVAHNFEYLNSFDTIVVNFDKDEAKVRPDGTTFFPGQEAAAKVAQMFPIGKVRVLHLSEGKDANDYLIAGKARQYVDEWWKAPTYVPGGLKLGKDMWAEVSAPDNMESIPYPFDGLNHLTYGIRLSELVLVTADTGVGKTQFLKEVEHHILKTTDKSVGFMHLEEPNKDTAIGLMSIEANKPLHLPDVKEQVSDDELRTYYDATVNSDRVVIWDHFGSNDIHEVLAKIRHMHNLGCKYIVVDHLSIIVSDQSGDERKQLDEISTKLKMLCMELNIAVICVIHTNRQGQIRSSAGPEKVANIIMMLKRNKEEPDEWRRNVTEVVVQKNRFSGRSGPACLLYYSDETGRLKELDGEEIQAYRGGGKPEEEFF